jgi:hypothetical protein
MNEKISTATVVSLVLIMGVAGCGRKSVDAKTQIDQAAQAMAKAEASQPPPTTTAAPTSAPAPARQMNEALTAYKSGNLEDAVTRFQTMRAHTAMSGEELMALNKAMSAVMGDIYARAAKGDVRAQQAVQEYQRLQQHR